MFYFYLSNENYLTRDIRKAELSIRFTVTRIAAKMEHAKCRNGEEIDEDDRKQ